jgi:transposase
MHAVVHPADIQDRDGGLLVLASLFGLYPFLQKLFADGGYQGEQFRRELANVLPRLSVDIVKRSDTAKGFEVLPRRWVVERTLAWLNRCRRLTKDFENLSRTALAFIRLASIRLMLRKLCNQLRTFRTDSKLDFPHFCPTSGHVITQEISSYAMKP